MPYSSHALIYINPKAILSFPFHFVTKSDAFASFSQSATCKFSLHFFPFFTLKHRLLRCIRPILPPQRWDKISREMLNFDLWKH